MVVCVDCKSEGITKARKVAVDRQGRPVPGKRCTTHHRAVKKTRSERAHTKRVEATYSITGDEYQALYESQGGVCFICRRATGASKRLSVDHDHQCCDGPISCGKCVRGLLCGPCNRGVIGHLRDDVDALLRAVEYLKRPPAQAVLLTLD
jgi:hypothetical protein